MKQKKEEDTKMKEDDKKDEDDTKEDAWYEGGWYEGEGERWVLWGDNSFFFLFKYTHHDLPHFLFIMLGMKG